MAYITAFGIGLRGLSDGIEDTEIRRRIGAAARGPLPALGIVRKVRIDQRIPKPARAILPGNRPLTVSLTVPDEEWHDLRMSGERRDQRRLIR